MKRSAHILFFLLLCASAQAQFTFECWSGARLPGDSCDICPNSVVQSKSFNGLIVYLDSAFFRWIEQPYSIRVKHDSIIEYWEQSVSPWNERITIPLGLTNFASIEGMADSTWCNGPGPIRYQSLSLDSIEEGLYKARVTGNDSGYWLRAGDNVSFSGQDTLRVDATGGGASSGNATTVAGGIVDWGGATTENTVVTSNGSHTVSWLNLGGIDFNSKSYLLLQNYRRFLHEKGAHTAMGSDTLFNLSVGYLAGQAFADASTGYANTLIGTKAGLALNGNSPSATSNTLIGAGAGEAITTGSFNTVVGTRAASTGPTTVDGVTATGHHALLNTTGAGNTAIGRSAAEATTSGLVTAVGSFSLYSNTTGSKNVAVGTGALRFNTTGIESTAIGHEAGYNTLGDENTWIGMQAGLGASGATATLNTGVGRKSMVAITTGVSNTGVGRSTLEACTSCDDNTAIGLNAGLSLTTGDRNTYIGRGAGSSNVTTGTDNIVVGYNNSPASDVSNVMMLGSAIYVTTQNSLASSLVGIGNTAPARKLHVTGEARITDLTTDTPTGVVGHDADGDLATVGFSGMSMVAGVLTADDGSTTNEIQTYAHTGTTSYTNTLSIGGGAFTLQAGTGMSLSHTGGTTTFASTITQYTDELAQDAVGGILVDGATIDLTYSDATPSITAEVIDNSISNAKIRQSAGLSVIGRSANTTGNVADITAGTDAHVLRRSGTSLGFGQVATGGIADDAVTYAKIQNVAANNVLLGNDNGAGSDVQELTAAEVQTVLGYIDGAGANQRIAYFTDANTLAAEAAFLYDAANDRQTIVCTTPALGINAAILNIQNAGTDGSGEFLRMDGSITGNLLAGMLNSNTSAATNNTMFYIAQQGNSAGDPVLQVQISGTGGNTAAIGLDNSDANKFKVTPNGATPGVNANASFVGTNDSPPKWGINTDAPAFPLDVSGKERADQYHGASVSWVSGDLSFGLGAGTGPTFTSMTGTNNWVRVQFSTGTSPTANNAIFTITRKSDYEFSTKGFPVFSAGNANTAGEITKFYISSDNGIQYTITANGTLTASTAYELYICFSGY